MSETTINGNVDFTPTQLAVETGWTEQEVEQVAEGTSSNLIDHTEPEGPPPLVGIIVTPSEHTMAVAETVTLTATPDPPEAVFNGPLLAVSGDDSIVAVAGLTDDTFECTGVSAGLTPVVVSDSVLTKQCDFTITEPAAKKRKAAK